ncbi:MAG: flagellar motor switch protein FliN [Ignavibacteria bacterium]|nr:flagellar motor switch protein FliN [Ignavibacteria bacterium]
MSMTQDEIDALISDAGSAPGDISDIDAGANSEASEQSAEYPKFPEMEFNQDDTIYSPLDPKLELLYDLKLPVSIELGRTNMLIRDILRLGRGSVIEFDKLVSEPVDVLINGKKVAEGEVVVIDKHFGIRVTTLIDPADRIRGVKNK